MNTINNYHNNVQFKGFLNAKKISYARRSSAILSAHKLSMPEKDVITLAGKSSSKKWSFFVQLADKFNSTNFYKAGNEKENSTIVKDVFDSVSDVHREHFDFLSSYNNTLNNIKRVFVAAKGNKKRLQFALNVNHDIQSRNPNTYEDLIPELLESPNSKEYIKHYDKYAQYLRVNAENKDVVKNLDKMVTSGDFEKNSSIEIKELRQKSYNWLNTEKFNSKFFADEYTPARGQLIDSIQDFGFVNDDVLKNGGDEVIKEMFLSTTPKNIDSRVDIIKFYNNNSKSTSTDNKLEKLNLLKNLFTKMDEDKHARGFINNLINSEVAFDINLKELSDVMNSIPALKLNIFRSNAKQIIKSTSNGERVAVLQKEIENPFYESYYARVNRRTSEKYGFKKRTSFLSKTISRIKNQLKIWKYNLMTLNGSSDYNTLETIQPQVINSRLTLNQIELSPFDVKIADITSEDIMPKDIIQKAKTETKQVETKTEEVEKIINKTEEKVNTTQTKSTDSKQQVKQNIFGIISAKLGLKTLEKQRELFGANATRIRLSLLPEIFSSIADTRKVDRAVGKRSINSSNKDALNLYLLINGSNRKYVNYLLKKRNNDNTRMFEVKDIITELKQANAKIAKNKKANPDYNANDARKYYNHLYNAKLEQYGKLKRQGNNINKNA